MRIAEFMKCNDAPVPGMVQGQFLLARSRGIVYTIEKRVFGKTGERGIDYETNNSERDL